MARARNIKPGFYKNEDLAECSVWARLIFPGLWMLADREGRLEDRPKRIKGELLPYDSVEVDPLLCELVKFGFILRYEVSGQRYIQILKFAEHQTPHVREQASTIPAPEGIEQSTAKVVPSTDLGSDEASPRSPDSLNPSSLNPESPYPQQGAGAATAVQISIAMRKAGVESQPADPRLIALAEQGVSVETVAAACAEAKKAKPNESIGVGYVVKILERWAKDAAGLKALGPITPQARASPAGRPEKFDPVAHVNRNRTRNQRDERTIDIDEFGEPIQQVV